MKKMTVVIFLLLCVALMFSACGKGKPEPARSGEAAAAAPLAPARATMPEGTRILKIGDMANAWSDLYKGNEKAINDYQGMPIMGLVTPPLAFAAAVQFDIMNLNNQDGRFEGKLMLAGYKGFVEKAGTQVSFGYDDTLQKDGFGPGAKAGDRQAASGSLALDTEYFAWESFSERAGKKIDRSRTEFKRLADGSMICLAVSGHSFNFRGEEDARGEAIFLHNEAGRYDFIIAKAKTGPEFKAISFADQGDLTKAQALELFKAAGYEIDKSGGIQGGNLVLDK